MPATGVKVTMFFQDDLFGFSESHVLVGAADLLTANQNYAYNLFKARLQVSGYGVQPVGVRLSIIGQSRASITLDPSQFNGIAPAQAKIGGANVETQTNDSDQAKAALQLKCYAGYQRKNLYLGGVPDPILGESPRVGRAVAYSAWYSLYQAYVAVLLGTNPQWGFVARATGAAYNAVLGQGFTNSATTGQLGIVVNTGDKTFTPGQVIQITGVRRTNPAYASANGLWTVASVVLATPSVGQNTYFLLNSANVPASSITSNGRVALVDYAAVRYTSIAIAGQTTRKRGNRFLVPVGRRRAKKVLPI